MDKIAVELFRQSVESGKGDAFPVLVKNNDALLLLQRKVGVDYSSSLLILASSNTGNLAL